MAEQKINYDDLHPGEEVAKRIREELMSNHLASAYRLTAGKNEMVEKFAEDMGLPIFLVNGDREP